MENGRIAGIGPMSGYARPEGAGETDLHGMVVLPGVIHSHSHFYGQFVRGIPLSAPMANCSRSSATCGGRSISSWTTT